MYFDGEIIFLPRWPAKMVAFQNQIHHLKYSPTLPVIPMGNQAVVLPLCWVGCCPVMGKPQEHLSVLIKLLLCKQMTWESC